MPDLNLVLAWLAAIAGAYLLLFVIAAWLVRRTAADVDDVVVGVLQVPVLLFLIIYAFSDLVSHSSLPAPIPDWVERADHLLLIGVVTWAVWRLVHDVVLYYGRELAKRTESSFDDVLIPVLDVLAPVIIFGTSGILILRFLGADFSTVLLTAGGAALVVGLAFRDTLSNILGGVMLLVDTPFRFGDLVVWEGIVCEIRNIGLRVTTFYNTEEHAEIFVPNTMLAGTKLINLTRPSPDLRVPIDISVTDRDLIPAVRAMLTELANANPYILGDLSVKLAGMKRALAGLDAASPRARELRWGINALGRERQVDRQLARAMALLDHLLEIIRAAEVGGFPAAELAAIQAEVGTLDEQDDRLKAAVRRWAMARTRDPQLARYPEERRRLLTDAEARLLAYDGRLAHLQHHLKHPDLYEAQRLDDMVVEFRDWLPRSFKLITPAWKHPLCGLGDMNRDHTIVRLWVYIDDIHFESHVRRLRVIADLRSTAVTRLQELAKKPS